ncbi:hypothetical protein VIGAN_07116600 [Vigna angularis var. angularis]|uniref:Uncharacterized protein n=1 Tax=Vigna angularis var. angularis TaxID=157739 RepID=A0A0S3SI14_PHAAN|nr:hypothetical protein VIGAN_07116600 [Vigna angularis var. angularis]
MSAATRAWIVASSIGAVEALKDQLGVCRWNYALRSLQQHAKTNIGSFTQTKSLSSATSVVVAHKVNRTEESMGKVMDLGCWGPNTIRRVVYSQRPPLVLHSHRRTLGVVIENPAATAAFHSRGDALADEVEATLIAVAHDELVVVASDGGRAGLRAGSARSEATAWEGSGGSRRRPGVLVISEDDVGDGVR